MSISLPQVLEVHLEELGQHSWLQALVNTVTGNYGSAQFRFVARPPDDEHRASDHQLVSATFPVMRAQDLNDVNAPNAWLDLARDSWQELDQQLVHDGWSRTADPAPHWWSATYSKAS